MFAPKGSVSTSGAFLLQCMPSVYFTLSVWNMMLSVTFFSVLFLLFLGLRSCLLDAGILALACFRVRVAMEFSADYGRFGLGGKNIDGEPLAKVREGANKGFDRQWAFEMLTNKYVANGQMTASRRSNVLAKVYGRIRLNQIGTARGKKFHVWPMAVTTAPTEYITVNADADRQKRKVKKPSKGKPL